jgi:hypothetical protein
MSHAHLHATRPGTVPLCLSFCVWETDPPGQQLRSVFPLVSNRLTAPGLALPVRQPPNIRHAHFGLGAQQLAEMSIPREVKRFISGYAPGPKNSAT